MNGLARINVSSSLHPVLPILRSDGMALRINLDISAAKGEAVSADKLYAQARH